MGAFLKEWGMTIKSQGVMFAILSGLFGWVWIGSTIAVLVFAGLALFSDWSWWNVLYALIASGIAKWLARGFLDNQKRIAFEQDLIAKVIRLSRLVRLGLKLIAEKIENLRKAGVLCLPPVIID